MFEVHSLICTFHDSKPAEAGESEPQKAQSACPKMRNALARVGSIRFEAVDALRCPNCDALFERGQSACYGVKPRAHSD
jgi:hypothetical protein